MTEAARMAKYGLTSYELELNIACLLKDLQQTAEQEDTLQSIDILDDLMDSNDLGRYQWLPLLIMLTRIRKGSDEP